MLSVSPFAFVHVLELEVVDMMAVVLSVRVVVLVVVLAVVLAVALLFDFWSPLTCFCV